MNERDKKRPVGFEIKMISKAIGRQLAKAPAISSAEKMTGTHAWIINFLAHRQEEVLYQKDVEKAFDISRSSATGVLKLMEKNGLIERSSVPGDARLKKVSITEKARALSADMEKDLHDMEEILIKGMSEEELEMLHALLLKVRTNLYEAEKESERTEEE